MKNLRKALAAVLALSVISVSGSALAATGCTLTGDGATFDATYDSEANSLTAEVLTGATIGEQMTFVILDQGADEKAEIEADDILYIDQKELTAYGDSFTGVINLARVSGATDAMPDGSYPVRLGYMTEAGFKMATGDLVIESTPSGRQITFIWGDVNASGAADQADAADILGKLVGQSAQVGSSEYAIGSEVISGMIWGDVNASGAADQADAADILGKLVGQSAQVGSSEYAIGAEVTILVPAE